MNLVIARIIGGMFGLEDAAPSTIQRRFTITLSATSIFAFLNVNYTLSYAVLVVRQLPECGSGVRTAEHPGQRGGHGRSSHPVQLTAVPDDRHRWDLGRHPGLLRRSDRSGYAGRSGHGGCRNSPRRDCDRRHLHRREPDRTGPAARRRAGPQPADPGRRRVPRRERLVSSDRWHRHFHQSCGDRRSFYAICARSRVWHPRCSQAPPSSW